jgi:hypothetical protein
MQINRLITMARTVFDNSNSEIVDYIPARGMDVQCLRILDAFADKLQQCAY